MYEMYCAFLLVAFHAKVLVKVSSWMRKPKSSKDRTDFLYLLNTKHSYG